MTRPAHLDDDIVCLSDAQADPPIVSTGNLKQAARKTRASTVAQLQNERGADLRSFRRRRLSHEGASGSPESVQVRDVVVLDGGSPQGDGPRRDKGRQRAFVDLTKDEDDINSIALGSNGKHLAAGKNAAPHNDDSDAVELLPDEARVLRAPKRRRLAEAVISEDLEDLITANADSEAGPFESDVAAGRETGTFSCMICYDDHPMEDCFVASMCRHMMCRDAARQVILSAISNCAFPILCPICQARGDPTCIKCERRRTDAAAAAAAADGDVDIPGGAGGGGGPPGGSGGGPPSAWCCSLDADITLLLSVEEEERYLENSLKAATNTCPDLLPCPQPDCPGVAVAGHEDDSPRLVCNVCKHNWCKACEVAWHEGKSCDDHIRERGEVAADAEFRKYEKKHTVKRCPFCNHGLMKISGCDHITCAGCKTAMCWRCLQRYADCARTRCNGYIPALPAALPGMAPGDAGWAGQLQQVIAGAFGAALGEENPNNGVSFPVAAAAAPMARRRGGFFSRPMRARW